MTPHDHSVVASFEVKYRSYLTPNGTIHGTLPDFSHDFRFMSSLYRAMVLTRAFDTKAVALQRTGRLGTYPVSLGQEGVAIGVGSAMRKEDVFFPTYRETGTLLWRGVKMEELLVFWGGDERGSNFSEAREDFPFAVPIASHLLHAAGVAYAFKLRKQPRVAVCVFGDGATSKGDVWESMNFAGAQKLPVIFVINNNQWAISVPRSEQTASQTLAQKAIAAGFTGEQVDGNDIIAVHDAMKNAVENARSGKGPHLIEAITYRLSDHTTADDARRYRSDAEVQKHWKEEPIARLRNYLVAQGVWGKKDEEQLVEDCQRKVEAAAQAYLSTTPRGAETMFEYLYETLPAAYQAQQDELKGGRHE